MQPTLFCFRSKLDFVDVLPKIKSTKPKLMSRLKRVQAIGPRLGELLKCWQSCINLGRISVGVMVRYVYQSNVQFYEHF